jgi:hypothetical protein
MAETKNSTQQETDRKRFSCIQSIFVLTRVLAVAMSHELSALIFSVPCFIYPQNTQEYKENTEGKDIS